AVSSFKTTTVENVRSSVLTVSGQRADALSPPTATVKVAQAVRPSAHMAAAGSQPMYRPAACGSRNAAVSVEKARTPRGGSTGSESGTRMRDEPESRQGIVGERQPGDPRAVRPQGNWAAVDGEARGARPCARASNGAE